jgi:hypothetical protein
MSSAKYTILMDHCRKEGRKEERKKERKKERKLKMSIYLIGRPIQYT